MAIKVLAIEMDTEADKRRAPNCFGIFLITPLVQKEVLRRCIIM